MIPAWMLFFPTVAAVIAALAWKHEAWRARGFRRLYADELNLAISLDTQLYEIRQARSEAVSRGNRTRAAKRKALQEATTEKLRAEVTA